MGTISARNGSVWIVLIEDDKGEVEALDAVFTFDEALEESRFCDEDPHIMKVSLVEVHVDKPSALRRELRELDGMEAEEV